MKSLARRGCCGCLVLILLLLLAVGCALGLSLWNVAVANAEGAFVVRLSDEVMESDYRTTPAGVFYEHEVTVTFDYGEVWLASTADGMGEMVTDDQVKLVVSHADGSEATWEHDFQSADRTRIVPLPATELSELFEVGENRVKITLTDVRSFTYSSSAYYLVMEPDESSNGQLVTSRGVRPTSPVTPTIAITITPTAVPTEVATKTLVRATKRADSGPAGEPAPTITATIKSQDEVTSALAGVSDHKNGLKIMPSPTLQPEKVSLGHVDEQMKSEGKRDWSLTWLIWPSVMVLVVARMRSQRQQKKQVRHTRLLGWLEGMDWQTGDVLPLVNLSVYPKGAAIVANPLRLIGLEAIEAYAVQGQVIAELQPTLSGVPELVVESEEKGLMTEEVRIGGLLLEYRNPFVSQNPMTIGHEVNWT